MKRYRDFLFEILKRIGLYLIIYLAVILCYAYILIRFFGIVYTVEYYMPVFIGGVVCLIVLVLHKYIEIQKQKYETEKQNKLFKENYAMLQELYHGNAKLYHDFHNHMNVIYNLIEAGKFEDVKDYIDAVSEPIHELSVFAVTGNDVVDIVLNSKKKMMEQNGIRFVMKAEFPSKLKIDAHDICIILSNLLDNAIESSIKYKETFSEEVPEVILAMRRVHGFMFIKIGNSTLYKTGNVLRTTKNNPALHGYGLRNIQNVVENYEGTLKIEHLGNLFQVLIMIPL